MTQVSARFHFNRFLFPIFTLSCDQNKTAVLTLPSGILIQQPCLIELAIRIISQMSCQCLMLLLYFCSVTISLKRLVMDLLFIFSPCSLYLNAFLMHNIQYLCKDLFNSDAYRDCTHPTSRGPFSFYNAYITIRKNTPINFLYIVFNQLGATIKSFPLTY